jgi:hypothetical protein
MLRIFAVALMGLALQVLALPGGALALDEKPSSAQVASQADEFAKQKTELLARLKELKIKIDGAGAVLTKRANAPAAAQEAIAEMRAIVSPLLAAVADNGDLAQLGTTALKNATDRRKALETDGRFSPEDRLKLVEAWDKRIKETGDALAELEKARVKFLQLLTTLQSKEDLIGEWAALKAQDEVIATIRQLTQALSETSVEVKNFIAWLESPGT